MAPERDQNSDVSKLVAREHALIVAADHVKKEPATARGRDLKDMMQGNQQLLRAVLAARGHGNASRPGHWHGEKMIIGTDTEPDGNVYDLGLGVASAGGSLYYTPSIYRIVETGDGGSASRGRVKIDWKASQSNFYDQRIKLAYWEEHVRISDNETIPAYRDVGLNKDDALQCYKNWLVRLYGFTFPTALLAPNNTRAQTAVIAEPTLPAPSPQHQQRKRKRDADTLAVEDDEVLQDPLSDLAAKLGFSNSLQWWLAFNRKDARLSEHLDTDDVCLRIGEGYNMTGPAPSKWLREPPPPPATVLREAWKEAEQLSLPLVQNTKALTLWLVAEASGKPVDKVIYGMSLDERKKKWTDDGAKRQAPEDSSKEKRTDAAKRQAAEDSGKDNRTDAMERQAAEDSSKDNRTDGSGAPRPSLVTDPNYDMFPPPLPLHTYNPLPQLRVRRSRPDPNDPFAQDNVFAALVELSRAREAQG